MSEPPMLERDTRPVRVWDAPTRIFHWALTALVVTSVASAKLDHMDVHLVSGQLILGLVLFRVIWGFVGSEHARFRAFVRGPGTVVHYARSLLRPPSAFHAGHNPLGALMVVAMLLVLAFQAGSGLFANDDIVTEGPFARFVTKATSDAITRWHYANSYLIYVLAAAHVLAVLGYLIVLRQNLIGPMFTGVKRVPVTETARDIARGRSALGVVLLLGCLAAVLVAVRLPRLLAGA